MSSVAWDPAKHPRQPSGSDRGGEWAAKAVAAAPRSIEKGDVPGFPPGVLEQDGAVMFWPKEIGTRHGEPFWKALVDRDGTERAFWFADDNGFPHHAAVRVLEGMEDPLTVELAGYGQRDVWGGRYRGANNARLTPQELDVALELVQKHARAISVAKDVAFARSVTAAAEPTMSPEQFTADTQASTRMAEVALTSVLAEAYRRALVSVAPDVARRFKQRAQSLTAAVWDPAKHPHRPGGNPSGGEWAPTVTSAVVGGKEEIDGLLDEVNDWPRLTREERNALGGSPRVYAIDGLVNAMADGNEVITLRKNGALVGVGTFREAKDKIYGGYFAATGGSGLPLFNAFLDVANERGKGVAFVAGNSHARKLYERVGIPNDKFRTPNDFTLTADEVRRLSEDMFALARERKSLAAAVVAAIGDESATFVSPDPAELVPKAMLAATIEKRTEEIRQQVVNVVAGGVLARAGISFDVGGIFSQRILDKVGARVRDADLSTRDAIRTVINEAQAKGWTVPETAGAIKAHILELSDSTAIQLARTDLIGTANASAIAAARMVFAGQQVTKQWLATEDERTRPTHADADGQVVPLDSAFLVGDSRLDYPGDPDGPDAEVCNCRCTILFDTERAITAASVWDSLVAAFNPTLHPHEPGGSPVGGRWARKGTPWTGPDLSPDPGYLSEVEESWYDDSGAQPDIVAIRHEMSMDDYQRETATRLREWLEPTYVATRIPSDLLDDVAESGRLKSQFETNRSGGTLNPSFRAYAEERMFGYDRELDPTARPIYGYVNKPGVGAGNVWFYGDAELELKPTVRARTTITDGDSLNVNRIPSAIDNPSHLSTAAPVAYTNPEMDYDPVKNGPARDPYIEAQIHGGVTLDDIAAVHLPPHLELDSATNTFPKGTPMWQSVDDRMRALKIIRDRGIPVYFDAEAR